MTGFHPGTLGVVVWGFGTTGGFVPVFNGLRGVTCRGKSPLSLTGVNSFWVFRWLFIRDFLGSPSWHLSFPFFLAGGR